MEPQQRMLTKREYSEKYGFSSRHIQRMAAEMRITAIDVKDVYREVLTAWKIDNKTRKLYEDRPPRPINPKLNREELCKEIMGIKDLLSAAVRRLEKIPTNILKNC